MFPPSQPTPAPNALVIPTGSRNLRRGGIAAAVLVLFGLLGPVGAISKVINSSGDEGSAVSTLAGGFVWLLIMGGIGVLCFIVIWKGRKARVSLDHNGLWYSDGKGQNIVPWHTLAGVGIYYAPVGRGGTICTLELCPNVLIDRDAPVLWPLVRDEEPLHPTLPRLRYRIPVPSPVRQSMAQAVQQYAPQLWLGETQRTVGYQGKPDIKGHRERTRGQAH